MYAHLSAKEIYGHPKLIDCQVQNDSNQERVARVIVGLGDDFESANAAVMYHARGIVSAAETTTLEQQKDILAMNKGDESTKVWMENWYDGLTYCKSLHLAIVVYNADIFRHVECTWPTTHRRKGPECS